MFTAPTKDSWIMLGAAAGMVVVASVAFYLPQARKLQTLRTQVATGRNAVEADAQKVAVLPSLIGQVQAMRVRYRDFDRRLPQRQELHEFLRQISSCLAEAELTSLSIEPGSPSREEHFHTLPIIMKCRGSYLSLAGFLDRLEKMPRLSRVQKLLIARDDKTEEELQRKDNLMIELQVNIYFTES